MIIYGIITALTVLADFFVKYYIKTNIALGEVFVSFGKIADFTYVENRGAAFSMLTGRGWFLSCVSIVFCTGVIVFWIVKKPRQPILCTALSLMFAGALGNAVDRIAYGYVVDFIALRFIDFPVFNIADIAITCGAALVIIYIIFFDKEEKHD